MAMVLNGARPNSWALKINVALITMKSTSFKKTGEENK